MSLARGSVADASCSPRTRYILLLTAYLSPLTAYRTTAASRAGSIRTALTLNEAILA